MSDVSMKRLMEIAEGRGIEWETSLSQVVERQDMASELIRLREMISNQDNFIRGSFIEGKAVIAIPIDEYVRCGGR